MIQNFSINNSAVKQTGSIVAFTTITVNDPAQSIKLNNDNKYNPLNKEDDLEELDDIDREVIFSSSL